MTALIDALCAAQPQMRIRLGSLEPRVVDEVFLPDPVPACESLPAVPPEHAVRL